MPSSPTNDARGASPSPEPPFGARLVEEIRRRSGSSANLDYRTIQRLKTADREETIRIFREKSSLLPYAVIQGMRELEPEELGRRLVTDLQMRAIVAAILFT